jgi:simple sugar transport system substrate-binding protein
MMIRRTALGLLAAAATAFAFAAPAEAAEKKKIGFIYVGPTGDFGWTHEHDIGRKAIEAEFGDLVETSISRTCPRARTPSARCARWPSQAMT